MKFKLVTGYYPSRATAEKILKKVKGNCPKARVEQFEDCFIVILYESNDYAKIDDAFSKYMKLKVYCGIQIGGVDDRDRKQRDIAPNQQRAVSE